MALEWLTKEFSNILERDLLTQNVAERVLLTETTQSSTSESQILRWKQILHSEMVDASDSEVQALVNLWGNVNAERMKWQHGQPFSGFTP